MSIDTSTIEDTVRKALADIAPEADLDALDPDAQLQETLDMDSVDLLSFVTAVHEATGVDIPERDYPQVSTLAGCIGYLAQRI